MIIKSGSVTLGTPCGVGSIYFTQTQNGATLEFENSAEIGCTFNEFTVNSNLHLDQTSSSNFVQSVIISNPSISLTNSFNESVSSFKIGDLINVYLSLNEELGTCLNTSKN